MRERRRRRRVGQVVRRHVHRLHGGDRSLLRRGDALLEETHLFREGRLIPHRARDASEERGHFGTCLREPENVVDEEEHVLVLVVTERFRHRERGKRDTGAGARRFVHLPEDERRLLEHAGFLHLIVEVVAFARPFADTREDRVAAVFLRDVADELLDDDRLADTRPAEEADLATLHEGTEEIDRLDARLEDLRLRRLFLERRRRPMDRMAHQNGRRRGPVDRLAEHVPHPSKRLVPDRHLDRRARRGRLHPSPESVGRTHRDRAHTSAAQMLVHLDDELPAVNERDHDRFMNRREHPLAELHVHHRPDDLQYFSVHDFMVTLLDGFIALENHKAVKQFNNSRAIDFSIFICYNDLL